jgi:unsaturated rhamnogalacturonyl hydrolase
MAQLDLIDKLPTNHPQRKLLINLLQRQITGLCRYQDTSGLWHQVIDRPDSYLETSGSAMFAYVIAKAVNEGWIPATYFVVAQRAWRAIAAKINDQGQVDDVCIGTNISDDLNYYYTRPRVLNDPHALGAILLAGSEMIRADLISKRH